MLKRYIKSEETQNSWNALYSNRDLGPTTYSCQPHLPGDCFSQSPEGPASLVEWVCRKKETVPSKSRLLTLEPSRSSLDKHWFVEFQCKLPNDTTYDTAHLQLHNKLQTNHSLYTKLTPIPLSDYLGLYHKTRILTSPTNGRDWEIPALNPHTHTHAQNHSTLTDTKSHIHHQTPTTLTSRLKMIFALNVAAIKINNDIAPSKKNKTK